MNASVRRRNTRQRQVVLEELKKTTSHPTAAELYELTRRRLPRISLGTVYRNLELLTQTGHVRKLVAGGSETRFDADVTDHYHVRCQRCGRVDDAHDLRVEPLTRGVADVSGYEILGYHLEFFGICPECRAQQTGPDTCQA